MQSRNEMEVKTDLFFHIVLYTKVWKVKMKGGDLVLSIGCLVDFEMWMLHSKMGYICKNETCITREVI